MKPQLRVLLFALGMAGGSATPLQAKLPPPYDFTGSWVGSATSRGETRALGADFASTSRPREFTGSSTLADGSGGRSSCTFTAKYKKMLKVHLTCNDGSKPTITARFDMATQTLAGSFLVGRRHPRRATFTLVRAV